MRIDDLDYELPASRIAQEPTARREDARLLVLDPGGAPCRHRAIRDLPAELAPGDLLVLNDTRVLAARLDARRDTGGRVEILALGERPDGGWSVLARAGGTLRAGEVLRLAGGEALRLVAPLGSGQWVAQGVGADLGALLERHGRMPLPPYIRREPGDLRAGRARPRALPDGLREPRRRRRRAHRRAPPHARAPRRARRARDRGRHGSRCTSASAPSSRSAPSASRTTACTRRRSRSPPRRPRRCAGRARAGGRVVAVGTTTVRALEASAAASDDGLPRPGAARTDLLIAPGYPVRVVDVLLTNFHLPRSTLLALVSALRRAGADPRRLRRGRSRGLPLLLLRRRDADPHAVACRGAPSRPPRRPAHARRPTRLPRRRRHVRRAARRRARASRGVGGRRPRRRHALDDEATPRSAPTHGRCSPRCARS